MEGGEERTTAEVVARAVAGTRPLSPGHNDVLALQRTVGNRAATRLLDSQPPNFRAGVISLQRQATVQEGYDWPTDAPTVNSPFPLRVLMGWLARNPVAPHDLSYESAYDRNHVEPDPLGCVWRGGSSNVSTVTDSFMTESSRHGFSFRRDDVFMTIRDQVAKAKRERAPDIAFMPKSAWNATGSAWGQWFPWPAYDDDTDQFSATKPDPIKGPGGPIVDWLEWYDFDAPWPASKDPDACVIHAQGETTGRVPGVVRLYCNDAIRAGFLGVDRTLVEKHVREDLEERKAEKPKDPTIRINRIDGRGLKDAAPKQASQDAPPQKVDVPADGGDGWQETVGPQWTWTAGKAGVDRTVQVQFQKGVAVVQGSVNLDTHAVQWMAGAQPPGISTKEKKILGALVSLQAFIQILAGVTYNSPASGTFSVQAAAAGQVTMKWGAITVQLQAGPQLAWDPTNGWQGQFAVNPAAGPTTTLPPGPGPPSGSGLPPPPILVRIGGSF
jgi:hypothetical protein